MPLDDVRLRLAAKLSVDAWKRIEVEKRDGGLFSQEERGKLGDVLQGFEVGGIPRSFNAV